MTNTPTELAKNIIETNQYMTIASSDVAGNVWASPVAYVYDEKYNLYWVSVPTTLHQQNIKANSKVAISIFDSHQLWGEGVGVQMEASVEELSDNDCVSATELYFSRIYPFGNVIGSFGQSLKDLLTEKVYRFYKATPVKVYVPDPNSEIDSRIEVIL